MGFHTKTLVTIIYKYVDHLSFYNAKRHKEHGSKLLEGEGGKKGRKQKLKKLKELLVTKFYSNRSIIKIKNQKHKRVPAVVVQSGS